LRCKSTLILGKGLESRHIVAVPEEELEIFGVMFDVVDILHEITKSARLIRAQSAKFAPHNLGRSLPCDASYERDVALVTVKCDGEAKTGT
jgi:hypothetical protein